MYGDDFDAAFCIGSPGPIWRSYASDPAGRLIAALLESGKPVAVIPSQFDISPLGTAEGLLVIGDAAGSTSLAARALLGALR